MKKISTAIGLVWLVVAAQAQTQPQTQPTELLAKSDFSRFVENPHHCALLLEDDDDGDTAAYRASLDAAINEIGHAPEKALAQIRQSCLQRPSDLRVVSLN
jgi:hypothetical protein